MVKTKITWDSEDFADIKGIFNLFQAAGYIVGSASPASEGSLLGSAGGQLAEYLMEVYKIVDEPDKNFHVWVIVGPEAIHNKIWRRYINVKVAKSGGYYVLFFTTESFSEYRLVLISDNDIFEAKFLPLKTGPLARNLLVMLLDRSVIETRGLGGIYSDLKKYSRDLTIKKYGAFFLIAMGCGEILLIIITPQETYNTIMIFLVGFVSLLLGSCFIGFVIIHKGK